MIYQYTIYGINLSVPFCCSMLPPVSGHITPDVVVTEGLVPRSLDDKVAEGYNWQASRGKFLLRGGKYAGRFLVENGNKITVEKSLTADNSKLATFLSTAVIVALLRQRGCLVLHASVVSTPYGVVAISGQSGVGKSTTQATLLKRGCQMLSDDIAVLNLASDGCINVLPGIPKLSLCEDAASKLGYEVNLLQRNPLRRSKVFVPTDIELKPSKELKIRTLYLLERNKVERLIVLKLGGAEKFAALQECIYGPLIPEEHPIIFPVLTTLAEQIEIKRIVRPDSGCSLNDIAEEILCV